MGAELVVGYCFILLGIEYSKTVWAGTVFSMFITVIFVRILALSCNEKAKEIVSKKYIWYMVFTTCTSVFVTHSLFYICNDYIYNIKLAYASSFLLIIVNVLSFRIYTKLSEEYEIKRENTVYAQQVEFYRKYILEREEMLLQVREGQHDIKNKWIFVLGLLNNDEVGKAKKFIMDSITDNGGFETKMDLSRSNNIVIDSMINYKLSIAEKKNIKLDVKVNIWIDIPVDNGDICVLLGNALDNAIEATMKVEEDRRFINLYIYCIKDTLVVTLINSYDKTVHNIDGKLLSTKKDKENHGIGLLSIKKVVDKYNGTFLIEESETFCLKIILYL